MSAVPSFCLSLCLLSSALFVSALVALFCLVPLLPRFLASASFPCFCLISSISNIVRLDI